jgi:hypothetical protein
MFFFGAQHGAEYPSFHFAATRTAGSVLPEIWAIAKKG